MIAVSVRRTVSRADVGRSRGVDGSIRMERSDEPTETAAIVEAAVRLGAPRDVAERAARRVACGDWASIRWVEPGDPELVVRW